MYLISSQSSSAEYLTTVHKYAAFWYHDWRFGTMTDVLVPLLTFWYHYWRFGTITDDLVPLLTFWYHDWRFGTVTDLLHKRSHPSRPGQHLSVYRRHFRVPYKLSASSQWWFHFGFELSWGEVNWKVSSNLDWVEIELKLDL